MSRETHPSVGPQIEDQAADRVVAVTAPSRLHFGLFSFGRRAGRQYGGVGAMIDTAAVRLRVARAERFEAAGPLAGRVQEFARRWAQFHRMPQDLPCRISVRAGAMQHVGLGTGTQLGLSVAAALNTFFGLPSPTPPELAISVRRGLRSAVGTYGFALGGLIVERGKTRSEVIAPLDARVDLPEGWRFVLIQPHASPGLYGPEEQSAFERLPPVSEATTARLIAEVRERLLPAAVQGDFDGFSESVYEYGRVAGSCFASIQGGPYNGPRLTKLVDTIRGLGVAGVGQSSWGPTLFAVLPDADSAQRFVEDMQRQTAEEQVQYVVTKPNNRGAEIRCRAADEETL